MKNKFGFETIKNILTSVNPSEEKTGLKIDKVIISEVKFVEREVVSHERGLGYELISHAGTVLTWTALFLTSYVVAFQ